MVGAYLAQSSIIEFRFLNTRYGAYPGAYLGAYLRGYRGLLFVVGLALTQRMSKILKGGPARTRGHISLIFGWFVVNKVASEANSSTLARTLLGQCRIGDMAPPMHF